MIKPRQLFKFFLLTLLLSPCNCIIAQENILPTTEQEQVQQQDDGSEKKKKKKDKESDETFFQFQLDRLNKFFFIRLLINIVAVIILIRFIYYPIYRNKDFLFTFFSFNVVIFIITYLLNKVELSTGAAFGLFAVFSLLRYRTEDISTKDMTYLFIVIALGLVNSVNKGNIADIAVINIVVVATSYALDGNLLMKTELVKTIQYEKIEMIRPENHSELIEDLKQRTGLNIHKISIEKVDFLRDSAAIKIYYYDGNSIKKA